jgi:hypothetical protein
MVRSIWHRGLVAAALFTGVYPGVALAALDTPFQCTAPDAIYFVGYETGNNEHVFVSTEFAPPRQNEQFEFALRATPMASGFRFANDFAEFWGKGRDASLTINGRKVPCIPAAANLPAPPPGGSMALNTPGRSLGGKVRSGPGTNFAAVGSLAEGASLTILSNAGVQFNGFDWFEISAGDLRGFHWGGIMCSDGVGIAGVYQQCGSSARVAPAAGWMALAVDERGAVGHGAAPDLPSAERFALQNCGNGNCRVVDATQNRCHAVADVLGNGYWYGYSSAGDVASAETAALGHCRTAAGPNACSVRYSYCQ